jgi:hypothetical protein
VAIPKPLAGGRRVAASDLPPVPAEDPSIVLPERDSFADSVDGTCPAALCDRTRLRADRLS